MAINENEWKTNMLYGLTNGREQDHIVMRPMDFDDFDPNGARFGSSTR